MLAELSVIPIGKENSISPFVAKIVTIIDESGLDYRMNAMATVVEGEMDQVLDLIRKCHGAAMKDVERVLIRVVIDDRQDKASPRLDKKLVSIEEKIGKSLKK